jgi:hypothetical protein
MEAMESCGFAYCIQPYVTKMTQNQKVTFVVKPFFSVREAYKSMKENGRIPKKKNRTPLDKFQDKVRT